MKQTISILGAGGWGTTIAVILAKKGLSVTLHSFFDDQNLLMKKQRENSAFLKGVKFPANLKIESSLEKAIDSRIIVMAVPVKFLRKILKKINQHRQKLKDKIIISLSKGIDSKTLKRPSQLIKDELGKVKFAVLSGPNIAREIVQNIPSTAVIASNDLRLAAGLQRLFTTPTFRIYLHNDLIGVEVGAALKNIIAIACGISDGLGFGTNTKAALVTRGLTEISRLGCKLGAKLETFWGVSGLGDLVTTCFSSYSRNRSLGQQVATGKSVEKVLLKMDMVAEGIETVKSAYRLSKLFKVDMPITSAVYSVLYKNKSPKKAVSTLMSRPLKTEKI